MGGCEHPQHTFVSLVRECEYKTLKTSKRVHTLASVAIVDLETLQRPALLVASLTSSKHLHAPTSQSATMTIEETADPQYFKEDDSPSSPVTTTTTTTTADSHNQHQHLHLHHHLSHSISISGVADFDATSSTGHHQLVVGDSGLLLEAARPTAPPSPFAASFVNVASVSRGSRILFATDEWFAAADNLLSDAPPHFDPTEYCPQGKVMDGWETRRRREAGHDWCLIELSGRSRLVALELDTAYFTGNHVPAISIELADLSGVQAVTLAQQLPGMIDRLLHGCIQGTGMNPEQVQIAEQACRTVSSWTEILPKTPLRPGFELTRQHLLELPSGPIEGTHLRVNYYPDGGVARMRVWGHVLSDQPRPVPGPPYAPQTTGSVCTVVSHDSSGTEDALGEETEEVPRLPSQQPYNYPELSSTLLGGFEVFCTNRHYGVPANLIQPTLGRDMGDGWETARHPNRPSILVKDPQTGLVDSPLMDWCVLQLGQLALGGVTRIILDTKHFCGNYPESVQVDGCYFLPNNGESETTDATTPTDLLLRDDLWFPLVARCRMSPDSEHMFDATQNQIWNSTRPVSHVKVSIYPDGGLSRVRIYGSTTTMTTGGDVP